MKNKKSLIATLVITKAKEKLSVSIRVFHKLHFAKKKKMQYQYAPLTGVYKPDMKEFFS